MFKRAVEFVLTVIILIGIGILGMRVRSEQQAIEYYHVAMAGQPAEGQEFNTAIDPYELASDTQNVAVLQGLAQEEAQRILSTGDMTRLQSEMKKDPILNAIANR
jgi:hypothetical protein